jgi:hypothetical protein
MDSRWDAVWAATDGWEHLALVAIIVATFAQTLFILIYASRPWWRVRVGRALMLKSASLCIVLWLTLVGTFFVYAHQEQVSALSLCVIAVAIVYQLVALLLSPRHPDR